MVWSTGKFEIYFGRGEGQMLFEECIKPDKGIENIVLRLLCLDKESGV